MHSCPSGSLLRMSQAHLISKPLCAIDFTNCNLTPRASGFKRKSIRVDGVLKFGIWCLNPKKHLPQLSLAIAYHPLTNGSTLASGRVLIKQQLALVCLKSELLNFATMVLEGTKTYGTYASSASSHAVKHKHYSN